MTWHHHTLLTNFIRIIKVCLFCSFTSALGHLSLGTWDCLPVIGVMSGATAAGLLQCSVGWHSITPCTALAIGDGRHRMACLRIIKVRPHRATPTPITLAESFVAYRLQTGRSGLQMSS